MRIGRLISLDNPFQIISLAVLIVALALALAIYLSLQPARIAAQFFTAPNHQDAPRVLATLSPDQTALVEIKGISTGKDESYLPISVADLLEEPDILGADEYNAFMRNQDQLYRIQQAPRLELHRADGRRLSVETRDAHIGDLPVLFWLQAFYCLSAFLIAASLWAFRRRQKEVRLLMLIASGYALGGITTAVYSTRQLALDGSVFLALNQISHLGVFMFIGFLLSLLCSYPVRLHSQAWIPRAAGAAALLAWCLSVIQWLDFYASFMLFFAGVVWLLWRQWQASMSNPLQRAAMQWFLLSIGLSTGFFFSLVMLPASMGFTPLLGTQGSMMVFIWLMFIGITLAVARYRLFDLGRWWFLALLWFVGGVSVIMLDLALLYLLSLPQSTALPLALVVVAWLYFPLRQWLWERFLGKKAGEVEDYLPLIIEGFLGTRTDDEMRQYWPALLKRVFSPLQMQNEDKPVDRVTIEDNGLRLDVPDVGGHGRISICYADQGTRLFSERDRKLAESLGSLVERSWEVAHARREGIHLERERIKRELHDGLGARLQTIMHGRYDPDQVAPLAQDAWRDLRDILSALEGSDRLLSEISGLWRSDIKRLSDSRQMTLDWSVDLQGEMSLPALTVLHLGRIISEAAQNAIRHARPSRISVKIRHSDRRLTIELVNDGVSDDSDDWVMGRGMHNIRHRASELGGIVSWTAATPGEVRFLLEVPLGA